MKNIHILKKPIISEKSIQAANKGVFTFEVSSSVAKPAIKKAIEEQFSVNVTKITTSIKKPRKKQTGRRRVTSYTSTQKIARAWLKKGEKIDLFEFEEQA